MRKSEEIAHSFSPTSSLDGRSSFFLVGIGGAGMSALARMFQRRGHEVSGSDATPSPETDRLVEEGIPVEIAHTGTTLGAAEVLVVSDAIDLESSPEVREARDRSMPIVRRSQALGWLLSDYQVIAVTGTHGKTTTTGMLGSALVAAGLDPLVVVGASIPEWSGPVREGKGRFAVVEACEAYDSFHDLNPAMVVLTNLELDHVDFHGNYENLRNSVVRFVNRMPREGKLIYCAEDAGAAEVAELTEREALPFGAAGSSFPEAVTLALPGKHNLLNAAGALLAAENAGSDREKATAGIAQFRGAERRLQVRLEGLITVIDDYAHHPSEILATLSAIRDRYFAPGGTHRRLIAVFQPHLYSRTAPLIQEFAEALGLADEVFLTDIYPAREKPMAGVSSARIAEQVSKPVHYVPSRHLLPRSVAKILRDGDVVVGMGAGNIAEFAPGLVAELARSGKPKTVAVLYGGDSAEREVSLHSGLAVTDALKRLGYGTRLVDMSDLLLSSGNLKEFIGPNRPDVAFLAVHGTHAEDGAIQGLLELLHIPYTGSGIQAGALAMDKAMTKRVLEREGIRVPKGVLLSSEDDGCPLVPPLIVKPNAQGSTVGLSFVEVHEELCPAIKTAFAYDDEVLVEEWIKGIEISTPVLIDRALLPVEIAPASGRYDFASKYLPDATVEIIPARLPSAVLEEAKAIALRAHRALGCRGATRTDAIVRLNESGQYEIFVLEVNTLPGMTGTSLLPNSAAASGIPFDELCRILVEDALERHASTL